MPRLPPPYIRPRAAGIAEHLRRAKLLCELADRQGEANAFRLRLCAVYSCRAIVELMLESASKREVAGFDETDEQANRRSIEAIIAPWFTYYDLIEVIRIHDFHRFGVQPPDAEVKQTFFGGPMKLTAQNGTASVVLSPEGPNTEISGNSTVRFQRSLLIEDGEFFDERSAMFVSLEKVVSTFVEEASAAIKNFNNMLK